MPTVDHAVALLTYYKNRVSGEQRRGIIRMSIPKVIGGLESEGATREEAEALLERAVDAVGGHWHLAEIPWARGTRTKTDRQVWIPLTAVRYD